MKEWLSIVEYARHYQVSDMTVRRRIKTGRLQAVLREGKYYIPASRMQDFTPPHPQESHFHQPPPVSPLRPMQSFSPPTQPQPQIAPPRPEVTATKTQEWFLLCREILVKLAEKEKWLEKHIVLKEKAHEATVAQLHVEAQARETHIRQLEQKIQDLQVFIQLLDEKKTAMRK